MTAQRPLSLILKTGHVLTTCANSLDWTCAPELKRPSDRPLGLRDLIERIAHEPGTAEAYDVAEENRPFGVTYAILAEIRAAHGHSFAWEIATPDDSGIIVLDELDEICCESRAWLRHASRAQVQGLAHAHNLQIGYTGPADQPREPVGRLRPEQAGRKLFLHGRDGLAIEMYVARAVHPRDLSFATYLASLSLLPQAA